MKFSKKARATDDTVRPQEESSTNAQLEDSLSMENVPMPPPPPPPPQQDELPIDIIDDYAHVVLLVGGGELSQKVAALAKCVGFEVDILNMQEEFAQKSLFPQARYVLWEEYDVIGAEYAIGSYHYIAILTPELEEILTALDHVFVSPARYIGVVGDEEIKEQLFEKLHQKGIPQTELACVCCPIGVNVGAEDLEEQTIAIVAELIAARAGKLSFPHTRR